MLLGIMLMFSLAFAGSYPVVPLTYAALSADTYRVATQAGDVACGASASQDWIYQGAKLIEMKSSSAIFGGPGDALSGDYYFAKVLFDPIGLTGTGSTSLNGTYFQSTNTNEWEPRIFWKAPGRDCYNWNNVIIIEPMIGLNAAGDPGTAWGNLRFENALISGSTKHTIVLNEGIGIGGANTAIEYISNPSYSTLRFKEEGAASAVYYNTFAGPGYVSYEPVFVTERGSRWLAVTTTGVSAQIATHFAKPTFTFRTAKPSVGGPNSNWPLYSFETLITDTVDRTPQNRQNTLPEDEYPSMLSDSDTNGAITSPLRAVAQNATVAKNLYKIGGSEYAPFADYTVVDDEAGATYNEKQAYWIGSTPSGVAYDASSAMRDVIVNKYSAMVDSAKFEGNDFGIPVCTGNLTTLDDWTSCNGSFGTSTYSPLTDRHRLTVRFLNDEWILSEMVAPTAELASSTAAINGGQIRLAKEKKYGLLMQGQTLSDSPLSVRLADVSVAYTCQNGEFPAIYDVLDSGNAVVGQVEMCPGTTYTFVQAGTNSSVKIHAYKTHPGFTMGEKWAETAIYSEEIFLRDGYRYDMVSSASPDKNFRVSLLWKNRDYTGAGSSTVADSLREIVVYQTDNFEKTPRGGTYNFLSSKPAFKVSYAGISPSGSVLPVPTPLTETDKQAKNAKIASTAKKTSKASDDVAPTAKKQKPALNATAKAKTKTSKVSVESRANAVEAVKAAGEAKCSEAAGQ